MGTTLKIQFSKSSKKFLEKATQKKGEKIRLLINKLALAVESGFIPFKELRIKKLEGKWSGYYRMRTNGIRIIYRIDKEANEILVYEIDFRGDIY